MNKLQRRIMGWIEDPSKYIKYPEIYSARKLPEPAPESCLNIKSLSCIRKNEISDDEIVILMYWLCGSDQEVSIEGVIHLGHDYKTEGDRYDININIDLAQNGEKDTFCIMVYEEDMPILLDPHDPIGMVTFHKNQGISVYKGDFRNVTSPMTYAYTYNTPNQIDLDAEADGCYRLEYSLLCADVQN